MKKVLILCLLVVFSGLQLQAQTCPTGDIVLSSQQEIDDFAATYPGCTILQHDLKIRETIPGDITSLAGLSQLTEVAGYVFIDATASLTSLSGLDNLTAIYNNLSLYDNESLVDLTGLENLTLIGGDLRLISNLALTSVDGLNSLDLVGGDVNIADQQLLNSLAGLESLTSVGGGFRVYLNPVLQNLAGLENLSAIGTDLELSDNPALASIAQLTSFTSLGGSIIIYNAALTSLEGLENFTSITGDVQLTILPQLQNLDDIAGITSIGGNFTISQLPLVERLFTSSSLASIGGLLNIVSNEQLLNLEGLENLNTVGSLAAVSNSALADFTGLEGLTEVTYLFTISGNEHLQSFAGLDNLASIGTRLLIIQNDGLTNLQGLSSLASVGTDFEIKDNDGLLSLSGIEQLTSIGGHVIIDKNAELVSLNGLEGITVINDQLEITANGDLINMAGLDNLTSIESYFILEYNVSLTSLSGLNNLSNITGLVQIYNNDNLTNLSGLESLTNLPGSLRINGNNGLTSLSGLDNLTTIGGGVEIWNQFQLPNLTGLGALESIGGYFSLLSNQNLESLAGLESLTTIGSYLWIRNYSLEDLSALSNLTTIGSYFQMDGNHALASLQGTENIDFTGIDRIELVDNPLLAVCGQENICDYIVTGGNVILSGNAEGCNEIEDLLQNCFADTPHHSLVGRVIADTDLSCSETNDETGIANWLVEVSSATFNYAVSTDSQGYYWLPVLLGDYTLNAVSPSAFWASCFTDTLLQVTTLGDSTTTDFFMQPQGDCPFIDWDVTIPPLRVCQSRTITVDYCNNGALPAEDVIFTITLDPVLTIDTASVPYTEDANGVLYFDLETLDLFECGQFTLDVFLACEGVEIGDFPCVEVSLLSEELCAPDPLWDGSLITASGYCENDSIYFQLENIGAGGMSAPAQLRVEIVIDDIILMLEVDDYQLPAGASQVLQYEVQGEGLRLEADQTPGHPVYNEVSAVVANCNSTSDGSFVMQLPMNDGDPFSGVFCAPAVNSYDPNIKTALPAGVGPEHLIDKDWTLNYMIQFQNTGNDVAYEVVIADTLSEALDLSSIDIKGASHPFTWELTPERALTFTFADILLPDSTTNEPGSHGFVEFSIRPKTSILPGTTIENTAHIYFDFNDAIVTNTVDHTIRKPVVASSERLDWCAGELYYGLPILQDTSIEIFVSFVEYDSIHFVHFNVSETAFSVDLEIPVGEYFQDILITNDTSITIGYVAVNGCDSLVTYLIDVLTSTNSPDAFADTQVYPNPVRSNLQVMQQQNGSSQTWTLMNSMGQVCWQEQLAPYQALNPIVMSKYPSGIYSLQVTTQHGTKSWKVVRE
ncbi:DUF7619 domain-containing protein [Lewinella cohaerens]|uniref:DUF7619 domain-containing protein n=1 Tax=Lewinella cohaerens TaxID=70995 RepID=UPI00035D874D|nr:T9SS type A sorting domain-containing protein [Lewinella cohaerens]